MRGSQVTEPAAMLTARSQNGSILSGPAPAAIRRTEAVRKLITSLPQRSSRGEDRPRGHAAIQGGPKRRELAFSTWFGRTEANKYCCFQTDDMRVDAKNQVSKHLSEPNTAGERASTGDLVHRQERNGLFSSFWRKIALSEKSLRDQTSWPNTSTLKQRTQR